MRPQKNPLSPSDDCHKTHVPGRCNTISKKKMGCYLQYTGFIPSINFTLNGEKH